MAVLRMAVGRRLLIGLGGRPMVSAPGNSAPKPSGGAYVRLGYVRASYVRDEATPAPSSGRYAKQGYVRTAYVAGG